MDATRYERGRQYAADAIAKRGAAEMVRAIAIRFCSPGDYDDATDYDRGVVDGTLELLQCEDCNRTRVLTGALCHAHRLPVPMLAPYER